MLKYSITLNLELFKCLLQLLIQSRSTGDQICTSPIMHLVCPHNIEKSSSSVSPGKLQYPGEIEKKFMQNFGGKRGVLREMCKWPIDLFTDTAAILN